MMKKSEPGRKAAVELRPSRIRRDPAMADKPQTLIKKDWNSREREIAIVIVGILLFALALDALTLGVNVITN